MKKALFVLIPLLASMPSMAEELHYNIVEFSESASVNVPNDTLNVVLTITETAKDRQTASNAVSRRVNTVLKRIKAHQDFESETENRHVYPEYDDKRRIVGWKDTATIRVKSMNFNALSKLAADSQNEAMIGNLYYSVSPQKHAQAVEEASEKALLAFRKRAEKVSRSLGFSQYKLVKLNLNRSFENHYAMQPNAMVMMAAAPRSAKARFSADAMDNNPGTQQIQQTVHGSIQM